MHRKHLAMMFIVLLMIPLFGCGIKNVLPGKDVPPLDDYSTILLAPFAFNKPEGKYVNLPTLLSYGVGTKLSVRHQDKTWYFNQSQEVQTVSDKLKELDISSVALYQDPQSAIKLAGAFQADLVIVGQMYNPKFTREASGKMEHEMSEASPTGGHLTYYATYQTATLKADLKIIDVKTAEVIWEGRVIGYKKYKNRYLTGSPEKWQRDETMLADVRKAFVEKFVEKIYPMKASEGEGS